MEKKNKGIIIIVIMLAIFILNLFAVLWFNNMVYNELETSAKSTLKDMANEQSQAVSLIIHNKEDNIKGIVDVIRYIGFDNETLYKSMELWVEEFEIETIILANTDGKAITSHGDNTDVSTQPNFISAVNGEVEMTSIYESNYSSSSVLTISAPIYFNGEIKGVIIAEYDVQDLATQLVGVTDSRGSSMIVNSAGDIMFHTYPFPISLENFKGADFEDGKQYSDILNDFSTLTSGDVTFSIAGEKKLGEYIPLGIDDWSLFFEISESDLSSSGDTIISSLIIISVSLILVFSALIIYILWARKKTVEQIEKEAYYDKLTGVSNLVKFKLNTKKIIDNPNFDGTNYILLKGDIENFKVINEAFGSDAGDAVICEMANIIKSMKGKVLEVARTGSDEFLVLAEKSKVTDFFANREKYNERLRQLSPELKKHIFVFRYGRYFLEKSENNVEEMINKVSIAHGYARAQSGWAMHDYDEDFKNHWLRMTELTNKMEDSLKNDEFKMFLQPKYNLEKNAIVGAEALVRWFESDGNMVFPNDFIPLFEKNGFITTLDEYIFATACKLISRRLSENKPCVPISVNFSRRHLLNPDFVQRIREIANTHNTPVDYLEIELTETAVIENADILNNVLQSLRKSGFKVAIDDFGSGHSALGMLKEYKFDIVKLDRTFFACPEEYRENAKTVLRGIINLITSLGSKVVAEGIEYEDQVEFLRTVNCYSVQGYYFARPMKSEEFEELLDK